MRAVSDLALRRKRVNLSDHCEHSLKNEIDIGGGGTNLIGGRFVFHWIDLECLSSVTHLNHQEYEIEF